MKMWWISPRHSSDRHVNEAKTQVTKKIRELCRMLVNRDCMKYMWNIVVGNICYQFKRVRVNWRKPISLNGTEGCLPEIYGFLSTVQVQRVLQKRRNQSSWVQKYFRNKSNQTKSQQENMLAHNIPVCGGPHFSGALRCIFVLNNTAFKR